MWGPYEGAWFVETPIFPITGRMSFTLATGTLWSCIPNVVKISCTVAAIGINQFDRSDRLCKVVGL